MTPALDAYQAPFRTEGGRRAYLACLKEGPLDRIHRDPQLRLAAAKGAKRFREQARYAHVYDQTYFAHALNVAITAGLLYEAVRLREGKDEPGEDEMKIVLAAGALHDFNKLPLAQGQPLDEALRSPSSPARVLLAGYVPDEHVESVLHLALGTEASDRIHASAYASILPPRRATLAAECLRLADQLAGTHADPNDPERYRRIVEDFRRQWRFLPEIQVQPLALLPQPTLAREARRLLVAWIRSHATLLHETERYVSWIGDARPGLKEFEDMDARLWSVLEIEPKVAFDKAGISHNAVRTSWTRFVEPTPQVVDAWVEYHGGRLVLWQGDWGIRHFERLSRDFPGVFQDDRPKQARVRVELPPDDPDAREAKNEPRRLAKLVIAHCLRQTLSRDRSLPERIPANYDVGNLPGVLGSTVPAILRAHAERSDPQAYPRLLAEIASLLLAQRGEASNPARGLVQALLGQPALPLPGATGESCIHCGVAAPAEVEDALVFGLKPTAWGPRKKGVQRETHTGRICEGCILENLLRDAAASKARAASSDKGHLTIHVHVADLVCDLDWGALRSLVKSERYDPGSSSLLLFPKSKPGGKPVGQLVPLRGHVSVPIPKPAGGGKTSDVEAHLYRLRDCLAFVRDTGFKLHVSPLGLTPGQERAQFRWTNAPSWMADLHLAEVHVDAFLPSEDRRRQPDAWSVVSALLSLGTAAGGSQGHRRLISSLLVHPFSVYGFRKHPAADIDTLGGYLVPEEDENRLTNVAVHYLAFNERKPWRHQSNNHWTWATRSALEVLEKHQSRHVQLSEQEKRDVVVSAIWRQAERGNPSARHEDVEAFVDSLLTLLQSYPGRGNPSGAYRRWVIDAIRYRCQKEYLARIPTDAQEKLVTP